MRITRRTAWFKLKEKLPKHVRTLAMVSQVQGRTKDLCAAKARKLQKKASSASDKLPASKRPEKDQATSTARLSEEGLRKMHGFRSGYIIWLRSSSHHLLLSLRSCSSHFSSCSSSFPTSQLFLFFSPLLMRGDVSSCRSQPFSARCRPPLPQPLRRPARPVTSCR